MKINEDEVIKDLKDKFNKFNEDYRRVLNYYNEYIDNHLIYDYENAIILSLISIQDVQADLGMLEYLWNKKSEKRKREKNKHGK